MCAEARFFFGALIMVASSSVRGRSWIHEALARCAVVGGGTVVVSAGVHRVEVPLQIPSCTTVIVARGAVVQAIPPVSGVRLLVMISNSRDIVLMGKGTLEGQDTFRFGLCGP
jgi:hypothetical protein